MRLLTPKRLRENEVFMRRLADVLIDEFAADGRCEFIRGYSQPFAMLVVADVLGVPESDHQRFREGFGLSSSPGKMGGGGEGMALNALEWLDDWFGRYIEDRRREPRARRADRPRARDVPGRLHSGRDLRRAHGDVPLRRRPGDDGPPAGRGLEVPVPSTPSSRTSCVPTASGSPTSSRRPCASRARSRPTSA